MASGSYIGVTPGSGAKLATGPTYTESSNVVQDQKVIAGELYLASYTIVGTSVSIATSASHLLQIMAGSTLNVRIRRIEIWPNTAAGSATLDGFNIVRLTSAGSGGGVVTPGPLNPADGASGATSMSLPSSKGAESTLLLQGTSVMYQTAPTAGTFGPYIRWDLDGERLPPIIIAAGTSNGIAVKNNVAVAGATVTLNVWITETPF
ncbi:MAG TPA: hypothetical protein VF781_15510 [Solirubrobacteraceae bacterium]